MSIEQRHDLPSPVASASSPAPSNTSTSGGRSSLPTPRRHALKPGSPKEIALINYVDEKISKITRRYGMKFVEADPQSNDAPGYTNLDQVIIDVEPLIDLAWATGTPAIQIQYLLSFAGTIMSYMPAFPFTFDMIRITKKLDTAFASLLKGTSGEAIQSHPVSITEKVRIKSLVEETKIMAVHVASSSGLFTMIQESSSSSSDNDDNHMNDAGEFDLMDVDDPDDDETTALAISRIYRQTIEILGDALVPPSTA